MFKGTIITGALGFDIHTLGVQILGYALRNKGYDVKSLGAQVTQEEFIDAAIETNADAILVSSSYGMGEIDVQGFGDKCKEVGLGDVLLYAGGNLGGENLLFQ